MPSHPDRALKLSGASNFRDLGGYTGDGGRPVRWRTLFRSDHLAALTQEDAQTFGALGVTRAFDFRGGAERAAAAYELPGVEQHSLPIEPTVVQRMKELLAAGHSVTAVETVELMQETYRAFVTDNSPRFARLFEHLLHNDAPMVLHCTAGKDRTGFAAALILRALGVAPEVVMQDYLLTNELYRAPALDDGRAAPQVLHVLWRVQADFLEAAMQAVDAHHGSLARYLQRELGVGDAERRRLAALYLER